MNPISEGYVLGIDAGTTDLRAIVFDESGREIARARSSYETISPKPNWAEQNAEDWWNALKASMKTLFHEHCVSTSEIKALSITHQRETFVPVDKNGTPLRTAILWYDARAKKQMEWLKDVISPHKVLKITGLPVAPNWSLPKILWMKDTQPELFKDAFKILLVSDFLTFRLTGNFSTSWASACTSQLFDINTFEWSEELLEMCQIPPLKLPELVPPGQILGRVSKEASEVTGLPEGIPIVAGGGDQQCGALGTGVTKTGIASVNLGTSVVIAAQVDEPLIDYQRRYWLRVACIPQKYIAENGIIGGAYTLKWFKENFGHLESEIANAIGVSPYDILMLEAKQAPQASLGLVLVPYWLGVAAPYWDENARGIMVGFTGYHKREHFIRAILEGIAYEVRRNIEGIEEALKEEIKEIRLYGGGARSNLWCQILADVCNKKVIVTQTEENTALGAAILAASVSLYKGIYEAANIMVHPRVKCNPIKENVTKHEKIYGRVYKLLFDQLRSLLKELDS